MLMWLSGLNNARSLIQDTGRQFSFQHLEFAHFPIPIISSKTPDPRGQVTAVNPRVGCRRCSVLPQRDVVYTCVGRARE